MKRLEIKTDHAEYFQPEFDVSKGVPIRPMGDTVLVLADRVIREKNGLVRFNEVSGEIADHAATTGTLLALGADAFTVNRNGTRAFVGDRPKPGMRVTFTRYSGQATVIDGNLFMLMQDDAIGGELLV